MKDPFYTALLAGEIHMDTWRERTVEQVRAFTDTVLHSRLQIAGKFNQDQSTTIVEDIWTRVRSALERPSSLDAFQETYHWLFLCLKKHPLQIRPVTVVDAPSVTHLFRNILPNADYTVTYPKFAHVERAFVEWKLDADGGGDMHLFFQASSSNRRLFVAELQGHLIGMGGVILSEGDSAELVRMGVAQHARKAGVAGSLLAACEDWAREQGKKQMVLDTWTVNLAAQSFYENNGYHKTKQICFELAEQFQRLGLGNVDGLTINDLVSWEMQKTL